MSISWRPPPPGRKLVVKTDLGKKYPKIPPQVILNVTHLAKKLQKCFGESTGTRVARWPNLRPDFGILAFFQPVWPQDFISGLLAVFRNLWPFLAVFRDFRGFLAFSGLFWLFPSWPGGENLAFSAPYGQIFEIWPQPSENTWQH